MKNTALAENTVKPLLKTKRQIAIPSTFYTLASKAALSFADLIFGIPTRAQRFYIFWVLSAKYFADNRVWGNAGECFLADH